MLITSNFLYHRPSVVSEAQELLQQENNIIIAGGSDALPQLKTDAISPAGLIDLSCLEELKKIEETEDGIYIGSMVTLSHLAKDELILKKLPALSQAARNVASPQIRTRGTVGGNILQARRCFYYNQTKEWRLGVPLCYKVGGERCIHVPGSPVCRALYYSDLAPVLLAYGALVEVYGRSRLTECQEIIDSHCEDSQKKILLTKLFIPKKSYHNVFAVFKKYSLRGSIDFPIINFAGVCGAEHLRIFAGAIASNVIELTETEKYIKERGKSFSESEALGVALEEMRGKNRIIRESGISVTVKRGTFVYIKELLTELKNNYRA